MSGAIEKVINAVQQYGIDCEKEDARTAELLLADARAELASLRADNARLREALEEAVEDIGKMPGVMREHGVEKTALEAEEAVGRWRTALSGFPAGAFVSLEELEGIEWKEFYPDVVDGGEVFRCPVCGGHREKMHAPDCWLARKLQTARGE